VLIAGDRVAFVNRGGTWTIFTRCESRGRETVGPGYIARARRADGVLVTDDWRRRSGLNAPGFGGLGAFGWHGARRHGRDFDYDYAWTIDGRNCGGVGVDHARVVSPPRVRHGVGRMTVDVFLRDNQVAPGHAMVRVRYRYRVLARVVHVAVNVTELCPHGRCGWGTSAFVKEPKLVANVNGGGYTRLVVLDANGRLARNVLEHSGTACTWTGVDPGSATRQCDDPLRETVRFEGPDVPALNVRMTAVGGLWQSGHGLDGWALASARRARYAAVDSGLDGVRWRCKARSTANGVLRRWELGGGAKDASGRYVVAAALFPAWEGGRGYGDCEPLSRSFGPGGETWSVLAAYWFN
jgi:hypothetical protein